MSEINDWGVMFLVIGGAVTAFMIFMPMITARSQFSGRGLIRQGLNELLDSYRKARNRRSAMILGPLLLLPGMFFARDQGSFFACLALTVCGLLLMKRSYSAERGLIVDYKKEAARLVAGGGKNPLGMLEKLDGEVRRGETILRAGNDYYLFPSAVIADKGGFSVRPWIVSTDSIRYMVYTTRRSNAKLLHCVYLYDEQGMAICVANAQKKEDASALMSELSRRFEVQDETQSAG